MTDGDQNDLELIRAQTSLLIKQSATEFWKIGVAIAVGASALTLALVAVF
ncbi:MAG: hypothetical protein AAF618_03505 [Pseudomonadota bacterium]